MLVLDTPDTIVVGSGVVDLRNEVLDLTLYSRPKDKSVFAARSPLHVRGPLRNPRVQPDATSLAARSPRRGRPRAPVIHRNRSGKGERLRAHVAAARDWSRPPPEARAGTRDGREVQSR